MKRSRKRNDDGNICTTMTTAAIATTNAPYPQNHRYYQKYSQQKDFDNDNDNDLKLCPGRRNKFVRRRCRRRSAIMAFYYLLAIFTYSAVLLLSNSIFLQVEVVTALAFKFPKPPGIMNNLINGRSNDGKSNAPVLQDWSLDEQTYTLIGTVTGHPAVPDGQIITTAPLEDENIDVAIKLLSIEKNTRKFIPRRHSSKHTKSITTISGTTYSLLPPNMRIGDAGLLSRGKDPYGKKQSSLSTTDFPYKQQLVYLEEQIEVVRLLAKREDELQEERKSQEIIRNTGIIAAMVIGASSIVGDGVNIDNIVNTFLDKIDDTTITTTTTPSAMNVRTTDGVKKGETTSMDEKTDDALKSKMFAEQAKVVLPYLEERIQSLEEQQKQQQQQQQQEQIADDNDNNSKAATKVEEEKSSALNEVVNNEDDSLLKTESSSIVRDEVKESINGIPNSQESEPTTSMATIQESVTKVMGEIKESLEQQTEDAQIEQKSELGENNEKKSSPVGENEVVIDTLQSKEQQQQLLQSKQREIFEETKKIANDLNLIREDTTKEFEKVISDLAWAGKKVLEADAMKLGDGASDSDKSYLESASSAISVFGEDGVALLYKYTTDAMNTVSDALSLDQSQAYVDSISQIWTELSSNINIANPQISDLLKKDYADYSDEEKTQLVTAASVVAIAGVTAAVLRSQWSPNQEQDFETGDTDFQNSEEYFQEEYSNIPAYSDIDSDASFASFQPDFEQQQPEASATDFSTETYANGVNPNPFPFATSASSSTWSDPSSSEEDMFSNQIEGDNAYDTPDPRGDMFKSSIVGDDFTTGQSLTTPYSQSMSGQVEPETEAQTQADIMNESNIEDYGADVDSSQLNGESGDDFGSFGVPITPTASKDFKEGVYEEQRMKDQGKTITKTPSSMNRSDANGVTRQNFPSIGVSSEKMKADQQGKNDRPKQSFSPFGATPKTSSSSNTFGAPTSPLSQFKQSSSPFERVTASSSSMGSNNAYDAAPKTTDEQEGKVVVTDAKRAVSPFDAGFGAPPKNTNQVASPFGAGAGFGPSQKTGAEPPKARKQGASSFGSGFEAPPRQGLAMSKTGKQAASPFRAGAPSGGGFGGLPKTGPPKNKAPGIRNQAASSASGKQAASPFGGGLGTPPKVGTNQVASPFGAGAAPKQGAEFPKFTAPGKQANSPFGGSFGGPPKTGAGPSGVRDQAASSAPGKQVASPFGGGGVGGPPKTGAEPPTNTAPEKQAASPFGGGFGGSPKTGSGSPGIRDQASSSALGKQAASPFGGGLGTPPKVGTNQVASPFGAGAGAAPKQGAEFPKFTAPGKQANSQFGGFGGSVKTNAAPKKAFPPFGTSPKTSSQTLPSGSFGANTPTSPSSTKTESSIKPKQSFSPFESSPKPPSTMSTSNSYDTPPETSNEQEGKVATTDSKQAASPFGAGFGAPPKVGANQVASPFGAGAGFGASQKTGAAGTFKSGSGFGAPPKQGLALPKIGKQGASPFIAGAAPKKGAAFPKFTAPGKKTDSPFGGGFGSSPKQTASPFGTGATLPKIKKQSAAPFGAESAPKQEAASVSTVFDTSEPSASSSRSRPKIPSKPQEDMYERMLSEQAKRDEDREQGKKVEGNNGSSAGSNNDSSSPISDDKSSPSLADKERSVAKESEGTTYQVVEVDAGLEEKRKLAKEAAEIEEDRRLIAKERAQLEEDRTKHANKIEDERTEFSNEDQKEEYRMREIKELAREQAKFEIEARERGFTKEEKAKKEKTRMDRLQKLAREQAQFEYDRKRTDVKSNDDKMQDRVSLNSQNSASPFQSADTPSNEDKMQNRVRHSSTASKKGDTLIEGKKITQDRANAKPQNDVSLFQSADTPSNEDKMQNRVRQSSTASKKGDTLIEGKKTTQDRANAKPQNDASLFQSADTPSNEDKMQDRVRQQSTVSKKEDVLIGTKRRTQDRANTKPQKDASLFQSADTPSNEDKMQDRVRQQSTVSKKEDVLIGTKKRTQDQTNTINSNEDKLQDRANVKSQNDSTPFQSADAPSNEDKMQERVRQQSTVSKKDDVLIGTKKKTQDRANTFQSARSTSKEEEMQEERARLDQLENLATNQARSKTDRTTSANDTRQSKNKKAIEKELYRKMLNEQIIDVEVFTLDDDKEKDITEKKKGTKQDQEEVRRKEEQLKEQQQQNQDEKKRKLEEKARLRSRQQSLENGKTRIENDNEKKMDPKSKNRLELEAQARQRSKQQSLRNGTLRSEVNSDTVGNGVSSKATTTTRSVVIEEHTQRDDKPNRLQTEPQLQGRIVLNEQQKVVADAVMKIDGSYKPCVEALVDTSMMLKQVCGTSITNYKGNKELLYKKSNVSVYVGRTESIPVRVSTPGTFVEFSINKKASEFDFGILAVPDNGYPVDVKKLAPFAQVGGKGQNLYRDTILVGAAIAPCTLYFKFENKHSTLLEKVIVTYEIKVTSPSKDLLLETRRLRTESCLQVVEDDIRTMTVGGKSFGLKEEVADLEALVEEKTKEIDSVMKEERRWESLIAKMDKVTDLKKDAAST